MWHMQCNVLGVAAEHIYFAIQYSSPVFQSNSPVQWLWTTFCELTFCCNKKVFFVQPTFSTCFNVSDVITHTHITHTSCNCFIISVLIISVFIPRLHLIWGWLKWKWMWKHCVKITVVHHRQLVKPTTTSTPC